MRPIPLSLVSLLCLGVFPLAAASTPALKPRAGAPTPYVGSSRLFESKIRPLLLGKCVTCHGPKLQQGQLRLDTPEGWAKGSSRGPVVVPGHPEQSALIRVVRHADPAQRMPPGDRLSEMEIASLIQWVREGARWPAASAGKASAAGEGAHWSFRPLRAPRAPAVRDGSWVRSPIDAFVLAGLRAKGLKPAPPVSRPTLIRRATFDLTGLPPTPAEVDAFVRDPAPDAYEKLIDRLLASPRYGEKWGRYWLDSVRYADSNGLDENYHYAHAFRYRDYVIDAFNRDLPYDQFLREQLAGDLLPTEDVAESRRRLIGTGFLMLGPKLLANPDKAQVQADIIDEQVDVTTRAFMGVTLSCARCHDHKFDPFTQKDYYRLAGIFQSTRTMVSLKDRVWSERPLAPEADVARATAHALRLEEKRKALKEAESKKAAADVLATLREAVTELERSAPPPVPYALAVAEGEAQDARLFVRGDHNNPAEAVPRGFPAVLAAAGQPPISGGRSGRLELAQWLTRPDHPLTARVMVNRVWQWHFGQGLVRTSDNFGKLGEKPSHPELLDYLAAGFAGVSGSRFQVSGSSNLKPETRNLKPWSIKDLHREIMLSNTYRMSAAHDPAACRRDPDNRLLWRMNRRRLTAEEQRDAMLSVAGDLDLAMGGSLLQYPNKERVTTDGSEDHAANSYGSKRRTVYLPVIRNSLYEMLELFDFADASAVTTQRSETISSPQALFMMNHPFMLETAARFADRLLQGSEGTDETRVARAYQAVFGRSPRPGELASAQAFLRSYTAEAARTGADSPAARRNAWRSFCQALFCANEFLYVD